ncbi:hypothetical protein RP20_CCG015589 [Aedes albopictus]|nr:uncharacterized protein LOC109424255 [Aedes albopictus]KXJ73545.1 hypothetical protein RP20_CCG015589 [Aedes albopictus]
MEQEEASSGFGLFDDCPEGELHPLQIDVFEDETEALDKQARLETNIYRPVKEGTELHRAIRSGKQQRIDALLNVYQLDFDKIRDYLVLKYQWDPDDRIWLRKINLVAVDRDQCKSVKDFERNRVAVGGLDLERSIFVLLQTPVDGDEVAVLHPECYDPLEQFRIIWKLFPNGYLSLNYCTEEHGRWETFVEAAAGNGNNYTINRLLSMGAQLCPPQHNPLLPACSSLRKDTIRYLLENHFDDFDFTQRKHYVNAFTILAQKNDVSILDYVLEKMIQYRQKYYEESKSQAFNSIFRYENDDCPSLTILTYLRPGKIYQKFEEYISKFELDLSYQRESVTILAHLVRKKLALEYCKTKILKNPELLGLKNLDGYGPTVLQECIRSEELDLLRDMYLLHPEVKQYFEFEYGFTVLREALDNHRHDRVRFILEHHKDYFLNNRERLEGIILNRNNIETFWEWNGALLSEHFPEFKEQIEDAIEKAHELQISKDLEREFKEITESIKINRMNVSKFQHLLSSIRGPSGETIMHFAVENDNLKLFKELLQAGCDLNALDKQGNHPIHFVRSVDMLNLIIDCHPDGRSLVNRVNLDGCSVLHKVCYLYTNSSTLVELVGAVIEYGADVNHLTNSGESAVFVTWSTPVLQMLLNHNINLDIVNDAGETALLRSLRYQNTWVARILLPLCWEKPTFAENAHKYLEPLLKIKRYAFNDYRALLDDNPDKIKLIFDAVYKHSRAEATRLFAFACERSRIYFIQKFLEYNYDLDYNYTDEYGYTPIMGLLNFDKERPGDLIRQLLEKGVDLEIRNQWGKTPLLKLVSYFGSARWSGEGIRVVQLLLEHGAQINAADDDGHTALHLAFRRWEWDLVELLIENGADVSLKDKDGKRPWEVGPYVNNEILGMIWSSPRSDLGL